MSKPVPKKGPGRPPREITETDMDRAYKLAMYGLTNEQIASVFRIAVSTLNARAELSDAIKSGRAEGADALYRTAYQMAVIDKNPSMVMFILKCKHGWREKQELDITHGFKPIVIHKADGSKLELGIKKEGDGE